MPHLVGYLQIGGTGLSKAECDLCHKRYGTMEQARDCEFSHIQEAIQVLCNHDAPEKEA